MVMLIAVEDHLLTRTRLRVLSCTALTFLSLHQTRNFWCSKYFLLLKYQICLQLDGKSSRLSSSAVENNFPADFTAATTRRRHESRPKYVEAAVKIRSSGFFCHQDFVQMVVQTSLLVS